MALADVAELQRSGLREMAAELEVEDKDVKFPSPCAPPPSAMAAGDKRCGESDGDCTGGNGECEHVAAGSSSTDQAGDLIDDDDLDDDIDYGDDSGGDCIYYDSGDEENFEAQTEEDEKKDDVDPNREKKQRYVLLTEDDIGARQEADTATVADVLSISPGISAILLRHFNWRADQIQDKWFSDEHRRIRDAVGLPLVPNDGVAAAEYSDLVCGICFDGFPNNGAEMLSAACAKHLYCRTCWCMYIRAAVEDGAPRCLGLRCPAPSCRAAVARELVAVAARPTDRARYAAFALRSYVEGSGGRIRWCPGRGCARAVEFVGCSSDDSPDVFCDCGHAFCFRCGKEAHRPVTCETVRRWAAKNASDSENANWVLVHAKHCPQCHLPIEKNTGCNHITCRCGYHFCWLCLQPAGITGPGIHYACGIDTKPPPPPAAEKETREEARRRQAKASLDRYIHHYERWAANLDSLNMALKDIGRLRRAGMVEMAGAVGCKETELDFLTEAYGQVADCRRVLRWSHAYGYFLDPERDAKKRELFQHLLNDANNALERLHGCAEVERKELIADPSSSGDGAGVVTRKKFEAYRQKLNNLTRVTRHYFGNLVKAFENDLPEIFAP